MLHTGSILPTSSPSPRAALLRPSPRCILDGSPPPPPSPRALLFCSRHHDAHWMDPPHLQHHPARCASSAVTTMHTGWILPTSSTTPRAALVRPSPRCTLDGSSPPPAPPRALR